MYLKYITLKLFQQKIIILSKFLSPPQKKKSILKGMDMQLGK